jgi:RNA polymerase sporulation-specific sigma factor
MHIDSEIQGNVHFEYPALSDEQLVDLVRNDNIDALETLIMRYRNTVRAKARTYFLVGADREDIVQEGMIGLYKSIRDFRGDKLTSFRGFAELCITRQMITAIKSATRQKHMPLNGYVSLDKPIFEEESERTLLDVISQATPSDPEEMLIHREDYLKLEHRIAEVLSGLERQVLQLYIDGRTYQEIAEDLRRHVKSIDNALQRIKRKLERYLTEQREATVANEGQTKNAQ